MRTAGTAGSEEDCKHYFLGQEELVVPDGCKLLLGHRRVGKTGSKIPYRECVVVRDGEWWFLVDPKTVPEEKEIVSTKTIDNKFVLALLADGSVVSLAKGKLFRKYFSL